MTPALLKASHEQWPRRNASRVELTLPLPPSVNALYYNRSKKELGIAKAIGKPLKGRGKTDRYRQWLRTAGNLINAQRPGRIGGAYTLTIIIGSGAALDLGNAEKAVSDILQEYGIVDNDKKANDIHLSRSEHVGARECRVTVTPALVAARAAA